MDGWLGTGDMYVRQPDGVFVHQGRADDMLKVGGLWCSPVEIESARVAHQAVLEAAVVGRPDDEGLIKPAAWIVLAGGVDPGPAVEDALRAH